jgi:hypothetical protein
MVEEIRKFRGISDSSQAFIGYQMQGMVIGMDLAASVLEKKSEAYFVQSTK